MTRSQKTLKLLVATVLLSAVALPGAAVYADAAPSLPAPGLDVPGDDTPVDGEGLLVIDQRGENRCIQITVWAKNTATGECREFGSPCTVPSGWEIYWFDPTCGEG